MDVSKADDDKLIRDRAIRLFTYLKELAKLKTAVTRDLSAYDKVVWFHEVPEYRGCFSILQSPDIEKTSDGMWLEVRKTPETKRPPTPPSCLKWLADTPDSGLLDEPQLKDEIVDTISGQHERLADHPEISEEWQRYIQNAWLPWTETYRRWKAADAIYFQLFSIYQQLKKLGEQYELILGLGLLTWETPNNQLIRRHIVVGNANLIFDADRAKFELQGSPEGVKLRFETEMVDPEHLPPLDQQKNTEALLSEIQESPWDKDELDKVLRSWIQSLSPDGSYIDSLTPPEKCSKRPTLTFAPAIILRQRTQRSQIECFNKIIQQITNGGNIPSGVSLLCEEPGDHYNVGIEQGEPEGGQFLDTTVYLPLPVNEEQVQIVHNIQNRRGVLVQGPPGTGKSHTIANLICHLLAQGKRVLVTSQTPRALRVLKDKIPDDIRKLCVTLLGDDQVARQELENSVQGINQQYSDWNPTKSQKLIISLEAQLFEIKKHIAEKRRLLREQREIETYTHNVAAGTYKGTAQQIATKVKEDDSKCNWLDDDVEENTPCPFSNVDFVELVRLYRELPYDYCSELQKELIGRDCIPNVAYFVKMLDDETITRQNFDMYSSRDTSPRYALIKQLPEDNIKSLYKTISDLIVAIGSIKNKFVWTTTAMTDVLTGNDTLWTELYEFMSKHLSGLREKSSLIQTLQVQLPSMDRKTLRSDALDLLEHLSKGGKLGWNIFAPQVAKRTRYIQKQAYVDGRTCSTLEKLQLLCTYLEVIDKIEILWSALQGKDNKEEGSLILQLGYLEGRLKSLEEVLGLDNDLDTAKNTVKAIQGLPEPQWHNVQDLEELLKDIQAAEYYHVYQQATLVIEDFIQKIRIVQSNPQTHSLNKDFMAALQDRNAQAWAICLEKLELLERASESLLFREQLQGRLNKAAPKLVQHLKSTFSDSNWDQRAGDFEAAWAWKQADRWLTRFSQEHNEKKLEAELQQLSEDEQKAIARLAAVKAWDNCLRGLTEFRRSNLLAYAAVMKNMPKSIKAKTRAQKMRQAQEYMDNCKAAIPAWIMPLYRVFETNPEPGAFDVVIIDEASQTGPEGSIIQYLGKQCIVVGDDQQINPEEFIFIPQVAINALITRYLDGVPFKDLYGPSMSLFTLASVRFGDRIVLREHFRCMPEIIKFSNQLCYAATPLKPLRQYPPDRLEPIIVHHVKNGFREGGAGNAVNRPEADALVEAIVEKCSLKAYANKTMGVISLQGEAQAKYIENKLLTRLSPADLEKRRIVCGDAYAFQGDERDIMFLSMVAAPDPPIQRIGALVKESDKRRFNVAASRARDQLVLFHTATLSDLNPDCMRYKLLKYCLNNPKILQSIPGIDLTKLRELANTAVARRGKPPPPFDSWFEIDVFFNIIDRGFRVFPQYQVAEYRIDLVVEVTNSQLAVECDGDKWHGIEEYEQDQARQRILERCGWRFWRIRGHEYYRDPSVSLEPLWKTLREMGIEPLLSTAKGVDEELQGQQPVVPRADIGSIHESMPVSTTLPVEKLQSQEQQPITAVEEIKTYNHAPGKSGTEPVQLTLYSKEPVSGGKIGSQPVEPQTANNASFKLVDFLSQKKIKFVDKRPQGGAIWLIGSHELDAVVKELKINWGISFTYLPQGGKASGHRPAWCSSTKQ